MPKQGKNSKQIFEKSFFDKSDEKNGISQVYVGAKYDKDKKGVWVYIKIEYGGGLAQRKKWLFIEVPKHV